MTKTLSSRFWNGVTFLVWLDLAALIAVTAALLVWTTWH
jgi:hypothetical protein